ncbi:MAG: reverse gyrase, partial [Thermoprotei archaeon]|nr:reverse gyrase [Thermoprotei archaeon]
MVKKGLLEVPHGIYRHGCINCGGEVSDLRLQHMLPCEKCLPLHVTDTLMLIKEPSHEKIIELTEKLGKLRNLRLLKHLISELNEVNRLFEKLIGNRMWNAQETWAKRVLKGQSFSIVAPTGVGKTAFAMVMSIFFALRNQKSYIILPTTPLVIQVYNRLKEFVEKLNAKIDVVTYHAKLSSKSKKEALEKIVNGEFHILVTTSRFLTSHYEKLLGKKFKFIVVDDVDAILKSSKNVDRILMIMGFTQEDIDLTFKLIRAKRRISTLKPGSEEYIKLSREIRKLQTLVEKLSRKTKTILIVSSATGRPRGLRVKLFRELLGFEVGTRSEFLRAIVDSYVKPKDTVENEVVRVVKLLGKGGLVFVPVDKGVEYAEYLVKKLSENGVAAKVFTSKEIKALEEFTKGQIDVLVGVATYYGVMVRGLDLPEIVRYAVFAGIPRFKFSTKLEDPHPLNILRALVIVREVIGERHEREIIDRLIVKIRKYLAVAPQAAIAELAEKLRQGKKPETDVEKVFSEALQYARKLMEDPEIKQKIKELKEIAVIEEEGKMFILVPDVMTYIQASGRTSRMFVGGITKGLSVVVVDDERLFYGLSRRLKWVIEEAEFVDFNSLELPKILEEINRDRELVKAVREGKVKVEKAREWFRTVLLVVESPNKARTIANFFGKPTIRRKGDLKVYEITTGKYLLMITATGGHVFDLAVTPGFHGVYVPKEHYVDTYLPVYDTIKRCLDCGYQFTEYAEDKGKVCPKCGSRNIRDSLETINFIKELAEEVDLVLIGTDPDTEGEKIGWDIAVHLRPYAKKLMRIEFHEVTKRAITEALDNPREFNRFLVEAQVVRRVEDRWIGFELSRRLWGVFG